MSVTIYGIKNCDTMKKTFNWLQDAGIGYEFHDYKKSGIDESTLKNWCQKLGWEKVLNRAGTTFKKLPDADKTGLDEAKAIALMVANPSMIKRPLLDQDNALMAGFKPDLYQEFFGQD